MAPAEFALPAGAAADELIHSFSVEVTPQQIMQLRSLVKHPSSRDADEATISRFIRATGGNLALSAKRLDTTSAWRAQEKPEARVCKACAKDPHSHFMHVSAFDKNSRPIIYSCLELAKNKVFEDNRDHMIQTFETAIKCMPKGVEQWVWVCDFHGFGARDINPRLAKLFLDISAEHYPERLGLFMVVDAPALFGVLWKAISSFVDPKTYRKIRFLPFDHKAPSSSKGDPASITTATTTSGSGKASTLEAEMLEHFSPATTAWLLAEMHDNRNKRMAAHKPYNTYSIYEQALQGELCDHRTHSPPTINTNTNTTSSSANGAVKVVAQQEEVAAVEGRFAGLDLGLSSDKAAATATAAAATANGGHHHHHHQRSVSSATCHCSRGVHDFRGTPELLHLYNSKPEILLPQATASAT